MIASRIKNFMDRAELINQYTNDKFSSVLFMLRAKSDRSVTIDGHYKGMPFTFRGLDYSAVREVLHDDEYTDIQKMLSHIPEPVVLDIGGNIGLFAMKVLSVNPKARILSVEASPKTFAVLNKNAEKNRQKFSSRWTAINAAAWKNAEDISFSDAQDSMSHHISEQGQIKVSGIDLQTLLNHPLLENKPVDLMKVDIEGAEEAFLCGADQLLKNVRCLIVELHPNYCNTDNVRETLARHFSRIEPVQGRKSTKPLLLCQN